METQLLIDVWPFFGLSVTLVYPTDDMIVDFVSLADDGIHPSGSTPFSSSWSLEPPQRRATSIAQFQWNCRVSFRADKWQLPLAVVVDDEVVDVQDAFATNFDKTGVATTGSWLAASRQGYGIGTEMRRAILHLLFEGLGAQIAKTEAFESNAASRRVTEKLGYIADGETISPRGDGRSERTVQYRLERDQWTHNDDIHIHGLAPCLRFFGDPGAAHPETINPDQDKTNYNHNSTKEVPL